MDRSLVAFSAAALVVAGAFTLAYRRPRHSKPGTTPGAATAQRRGHEAASAEVAEPEVATSARERSSVAALLAQRRSDGQCTTARRGSVDGVHVRSEASVSGRSAADNPRLAGSHDNEHHRRRSCDDGREDVVPYAVATGSSLGEVRVLHVTQLRAAFPAPPGHAPYPNLRWAASHSIAQRAAYTNIIDDSHLVLQGVVHRTNTVAAASEGGGQGPPIAAYVRAGPRQDLFFAPPEVRPAVITCGGLAPGANDVVRGIVKDLHDLYGVTTVLGMRNGFAGFKRDEFTLLTADMLSHGAIHHRAGTILGTSREPLDLDVACEFISRHGVNQVYVVGGDGSHHAAHLLATTLLERRIKCSVAAVPVTVDNDLALVDKCVGFETAVQEAQRAIQSAKTEAKCAPHGIGIVKLFGWASGFIAAFATLASSDVDLCLVPEIAVHMHGRLGILEYVERKLREQGHVVILVSMGAGEHLLKDQGSMQPIGQYLTQALKDFLTPRLPNTADGPVVKYHDPSFMIRSQPATASDSIYARILAQNAVHGAMAGFTDFCACQANNRMVYMPLDLVVRHSPRRMNRGGRTMERVYGSTGQPDTRAQDDAAE